MSNAKERSALAERLMTGPRTLIIFSLLISCVFVSPGIASAQIADPVGVCVDVRGCDGPSGNSGGGWTLSGSPASVTVQAMLYGGGLGALAGSLAADVNGEPQWMTGSLAGFGLMLEIGTLKNKWGRLYKTFTGGVAGASAGAAWGNYKLGQTETGSPEAETAKSEVVRDAVIGALVLAPAHFVGPSLDLNHLPLLRRFVGSSRPVKLINNGQRIGMRIEW